MTVERQAFFEPEDILKEVKRKLGRAAQRNEETDYLTLVPDGEPTLDINLGKTIRLLRQTNIPVAVLTNASLVWRGDVKKDLMDADLVCLKADAVSKDLWTTINRPHKDLKLDVVLEGMTQFARQFKGTIISETMLIDGLSYGDELEKIADFLKKLETLDKAYISIPTRPPTEKWVKPAKKKTVSDAFRIFSKRLGVKRVERVTGYEGDSFTFLGKVEEDLLSITAVHPMRKEAVVEFLRKANADWHVIERLLEENRLTELEYKGKKYYQRRGGNRVET